MATTACATHPDADGCIKVKLSRTYATAVEIVESSADQGETLCGEIDHRRRETNQARLLLVLPAVFASVRASPAIYGPHRKAPDEVKVSVTRLRLRKN